MLTFNKKLHFLIDKPDPLRLQVENNDINEIVQKKRGDPLTVFCIGNDLGNPSETLQWFKSSSVMAINNTFSVSPTILSLDFKNGLMKENNGTYTCRIANEVGSQEKSFQLVVLGKVSLE